MSKKKQQNRETLKRHIGEYMESCSQDMLIDSALDRFIMYGTNYPKADKNDYSEPVRKYKKNNDK